jgi:hypothetical protein
MIAKIFGGTVALVVLLLGSVAVGTHGGVAAAPIVAADLMSNLGHIVPAVVHETWALMIGLEKYSFD